MSDYVDWNIDVPDYDPPSYVTRNAYDGIQEAIQEAYAQGYKDGYAEGYCKLP